MNSRTWDFCIVVLMGVTAFGFLWSSHCDADRLAPMTRADGYAIRASIWFAATTVAGFVVRKRNEP